MKNAKVVISWPMGLSLHPAARLMQLTQAFHSKVRLRLGGKVADASNVLSVLILCATMNTILEIQATGSDEKEVLGAVEAFFESSPSKNFKVDRFIA